MSAARKAPVPAQGEVARPTSAELEAHCCACEKHLSDAEAVLRDAAAALAVPHDDVDQRSHEQAVEHNARLRVEKARKTLEEHRCNLEATKRREDEAEALELAGRVSRPAQMRELKAINKAFEKLVVDGLRQFFADLIERRAGFETDARKLNHVWRRLGHKHCLPNVDVALGTGSAEIPAQVSLDTLRSYSGPLVELLKQRVSSRDPLERAAVILLIGAFDHDRERHNAMRTLEEAVHDRIAEIAKEGQGQ